MHFLHSPRRPEETNKRKHRLVEGKGMSVTTACREAKRHHHDIIVAKANGHTSFGLQGPRGILIPRRGGLLCRKD